MTTPSSGCDVLWYGVGFGRGHATKAAGALRRIDASCHVVLGPACDPTPLEVTGISHQLLDVHPRDIASVLAGLEPRVLVVDAFPLGPWGELDDALEDIAPRRVLVRRVEPGLLGPLPEEDRYDAVLALERDHRVPGVDCTPWLLYDDHELLDPIEARRRLGGEDGRLVVLDLLPNSGADHARQIVSESGIPTVRTDVDPALLVFNGVDGIVSTAGTALPAEASACGVPTALFWRTGSIDQPLRCPRPMADAGSLRAWYEGLSVRPPVRVTYRNGAQLAARIISGFLR